MLLDLPKIKLLQATEFESHWQSTKFRRSDGKRWYVCTGVWQICYCGPMIVSGNNQVTYHCDDWSTASLHLKSTGPSHSLLYNGYRSFPPDTISSSSGCIWHYDRPDTSSKFPTKSQSHYLSLCCFSHREEVIELSNKGLPWSHIAADLELLPWERFLPTQALTTETFFSVSKCRNRSTYGDGQGDA